jgi:hypothetical protein
MGYKFMYRERFSELTLSENQCIKASEYVYTQTNTNPDIAPPTASTKVCEQKSAVIQYYDFVLPSIFFYGATAGSEPGHPCYRGFTITPTQ